MVDLKQVPGVHMKDSLQSEVIDGTDMALETMLQAFQIAEQFNLAWKKSYWRRKTGANIPGIIRRGIDLRAIRMRNQASGSMPGIVWLRCVPN